MMFLALNGGGRSEEYLAQQKGRFEAYSTCRPSFADYADNRNYCTVIQHHGILCRNHLCGYLTKTKARQGLSQGP